MSRGAQAGLLVALLILLPGCAELDTTYGSSGPSTDSVNGVRVLKVRVAERLPLRTINGLDPSLLADRDLTALVYVVRSRGALPDHVAGWLGRWLRQHPGRVAMVVLRDGGVGAFLCRRWADEAERAAESASDQDRAAAHRARAQRWRERAAKEEVIEATGRDPGDVWGRLAEDDGEDDGDEDADDPSPSHGSGLRLHVDPHPSEGADEWRGAGPLGVPATLRLGDRLTVLDDDEVLPGEPLVEARVGGGWQPLAGRWDVGRGRLVVVANATALVDGALPDPSARALLGLLLDELPRSGRVAWVADARTGGRDDATPDVLAILFRSGPVSWAMWHLVALFVLFVLWRGRQLGRREPADRRVSLRFAAHVAALAEWLRRDDARAWARERLRHHADPPAAPPQGPP